MSATQAFHFLAIPPFPGRHISKFVRLPGDSETEDGHVLYEFGDYSEFAYWAPAKPEEFEDWPEGHKGQWILAMSEPDGMIGWCGPFRVPEPPAVL